MAILDSFTDATDPISLSLHTPDVATSPSTGIWFEMVSTWTVTGGHVKANTVKPTPALCLVPAGATDGAVETLVFPSAASTNNYGLVFRAIGSQDHLALYYNNNSKILRLDHMVSGAVSSNLFLLPIVPAPPALVGVTLRVEYAGDQIKIYFSGALVGTVTSTINQVYVFVGLTDELGSGIHAQFFDFTYEDPVPPATSVPSNLIGCKILP